MKKSIIAITIVAIAVAFALGRFSTQTTGSHERSPRTSEQVSAPYDFEQPASTMSVAEATTLRSGHYEELHSIDAILELPTDFAQTEALYILAGRADEPELQHLIFQSIKITDRYERTAALQVLFSRYVEIEPSAAVDFLIEIDLDIDDMIVRGVFQQWAKSDLNGAIDKANNIQNVRLRRYAGNAVLSAVARSDPGRLTDVAANLVDHQRLEYLEAEAIGIRANHDPETALREALTLRNFNGRWNAVNRVGHVWARNDPKGAITFAKQISNPRLREQFVNSVLERWIGDAPEDAIQNILANPDPQMRAKFLEQGLKVYARNDPVNALVIAAQLDANVKAKVYAEIYSDWVLQDPDAAMIEFAAVESKALREGILSHVSQTLTSNNPDAAIRWVESLSSTEKARYMPQMLRGLSQSDPERAIQLALAGASQQERETRLNSIMLTVSHFDPQLALKHVSQLPAGEQQQGIYRNIAKNWMNSDQDAAMAWIETLSGEEYNFAASGAAVMVAHRNPQLAETMISRLPAGKQSEAIQQVAHGFSYQDPEAAMAWLMRFRNTSGFDQNVSNVVRFVAQRNPQGAMDMAAGLGEGQRLQAIKDVLPRWVGMDASSAAQWVNTLPSGASKDNALVTLATTGQYDVTQSSRFINAIRSADLRNQVVVDTARALYLRTQDQSAVARLLEQVNANSATRAQVSQLTGG